MGRKEGVEGKLELWLQTLESQALRLRIFKTLYLEIKFSG